MTSQEEAVFKAALRLASNARAELAERLWESLDESDRNAVSEEWAAEIGRRSDELRRGEVTPIPGEQAMREARETIARNGHRR